MSDENNTTDADSLQRQSALTGDSPLSDAACCASSDFIPPPESGSARHNDKSLIARFAVHPNAAKIMDEALVNLDVLVDLGKNTRVCPDHLVVWIRQWQEFGRPNPAEWYRAFCSGEASRIREAGLPLTLGQENQQEGLVQDSLVSAQRQSERTPTSESQLRNGGEAVNSDDTPPTKGLVGVAAPRLVRFSSLSDALEHAAPSLLIDLSGIGLIRAEVVQMKGLKLRGLRRRPDGLWEEHPWGSCSESPQAQ